MAAFEVFPRIEAVRSITPSAALVIGHPEFALENVGILDDCCISLVDIDVQICAQVCDQIHSFASHLPALQLLSVARLGVVVEYVAIAGPAPSSRALIGVAVAASAPLTQLAGRLGDLPKLQLGSRLFQLVPLGHSPRRRHQVIRCVLRPVFWLGRGQIFVVDFIGCLHIYSYSF